MSQNKKPYTEYEFKGLNLAGNPLTRELGTASDCTNVRVMPGNWLRLKGGRKARLNFTNASSVAHFINPAIYSAVGNDYALAQVNYSGTRKMVRLNLTDWTADETGLETISAAYESTHFYAHAVLADSVVWDNGKGCSEAGIVPVPSLTQWQPASTVRYFGLDCEKNGAVNVSFSSGGSGLNSVTTSVSIYVGLHNTATQHFSNGILIGTLTSTGGTGEISVSGLLNISYPTHGASETSELKWVFYATIDGYNVAYLIMDSTLSGPFTVDVTSNTAELDITSGTVNGWVLDTTKERPVTNYAPRRMRSICYASGRLYGILSPTSSVSGLGLRYQIAANELHKVVWSDAAGSVQNRDYLGDPLQSWPATNASNVPGGERPLVVYPAPNLAEVMVFTATKVFILREQADGVHDWDTISNEHGLDPQTSYRVVTRTRHGVVWVTQNKQLAIYTNEGEFKILSRDYDASAYVTGAAVTAILYVYDPINLIDQVHVYRTNTSYTHDFETGAWINSEPHAVYAAGVLQRQGTYNPEKHFAIAATSAAGSGQGIYTIAGQYDQSGLEVTYDEVFAGASGSTKNTQELAVGNFTSNWFTFNDPNWRKEIQYIDFIGDARTTESLIYGAIVMTWYTALNNTSALTVSPMKVPQESASDYYYRFKISKPHRWAWKFNLFFYSHYATRSTFPRPGQEGLQSANNFYGAMVALMIHYASGENRL